MWLISPAGTGKRFDYVPVMLYLGLITGVFAGIVEIAVVGYVLVKLMSLLRARLLVWHPEALEPTTV